MMLRGSKQTLGDVEAKILAACDESEGRTAIEIRKLTKVGKHMIGPRLSVLATRMLLKAAGLVEHRGRPPLLKWVRTAAGTAALRKWREVQIRAAAGRAAGAAVLLLVLLAGCNKPPPDCRSEALARIDRELGNDVGYACRARQDRQCLDYFVPVIARLRQERARVVREGCGIDGGGQ
jgi:hypothetical protein